MIIVIMKFHDVISLSVMAWDRMMEYYDIYLINMKCQIWLVIKLIVISGINWEIWYAILM